MTRHVAIAFVFVLAIGLTSLQIETSTLQQTAAIDSSVLPEHISVPSNGTIDYSNEIIREQQQQQQQLNKLKINHLLIDQNNVRSNPTALTGENKDASILTDSDINSQKPRANPHETTLVVYSGPTSMKRAERKNELYLRNFDFFLTHGLDCQRQDTVVTLTSEVKAVYQDRLDRLAYDCATRTGHRLFVVEREAVCYDMETMRVLMYEQRNEARNSSSSTSTTTTADNMPSIKSYRYLVYINCGMTGPAPELADGWTDLFTKHLSDQITMTGLSLNCHGVAHVQSFAFALNQAGLDVIYEKEAVFDCRNSTYEGEPKRKWPKLLFQDIVQKYERGMSYHILRKRFSIKSIIPQWQVTVTRKNYTKCTNTDPWNYGDLNSTFGGRLPLLKEVIFFKTSRFLPKKIGDLIDYPGEPQWHQKRSFLTIRHLLGYDYNVSSDNLTALLPPAQ